MAGGFVTNTAKLRRRSRAAKLFGQLADLQPIHLEFQRAERNAKIPRGRRDVPAGLFERPVGARLDGGEVGTV